MCALDIYQCKTWIDYDFIDEAKLIEDYRDRFMVLYGGYEE